MTSKEIKGSVFGTLDIRQTSCSDAEFHLKSTIKYNHLPCQTEELLDLRASINDTYAVYTTF